MSKCAKIVLIFNLLNFCTCSFCLEFCHRYLNPRLSLLVHDPIHQNDLLLAIYRILDHDYNLFSPTLNLAPLARMPSCMMITLIFSLRLSDGERQELKARQFGDNEALQFQFDEFVFDENQRIAEMKEQLVHDAILYAQQQSSSVDGPVLTSSDLCPLIVDICGVLLPKQKLNAPISTVTEPLIFTENAVDCLYQTALSISMREPVLLTGPPSSGKSHLISYMATTLGQRLVTMHLTESTDAKALLGSYVCTDQPGEFKYQLGILSKAVQNGYWLVIEDIDYAPPDVIAQLEGVIERGELHLGGGRGEVISAHRCFRLFATVSTQSSTFFLPSLNRFRWTKAFLDEPAKEDLRMIVLERFPALGGDVVDWMMHGYDVAVNLMAETNGKWNSRQVTIRDLIKWCNRVDSLRQSEPMEFNISSHETRFNIFMDGVDLFFESISNYAFQKSLITMFADSFRLSEETLKWYLDQRTPEVHIETSIFRAGRIQFNCDELQNRVIKTGNSAPFTQTSYVRRVIERLAAALNPSIQEPLLLVGETGTGKTTIVQHLSGMFNRKLHVINLSQQSDSSDLLGGFKPVDIRSHTALPLKEAFDDLFEKTFSLKENAKFIEACRRLWCQSNWAKLAQLWEMGFEKARKKFCRLDSCVVDQWTDFEKRVANFRSQLHSQKSGMLFSFVEGLLIQAIKNGDWVLLDEVNLASSETLECMSSLLQSSKGSIVLADRGDDQEIERHAGFRLFACMNPSTDVGKRDLPIGLRNRFTELWIGGVDEHIEMSSTPNDLQGFHVEIGSQPFKDLLMIVSDYLNPIMSSDADKMVKMSVAYFYLHTKHLVEQNQLTAGSSGATEKPHFSLRTLTRALVFAQKIFGYFGLRRSVYEGLLMSFTSMLDPASKHVVTQILQFWILFDGQSKNVSQKAANELLSRKAILPSNLKNSMTEQYTELYGFLIPRGAYASFASDVQIQNNYIMTHSVESNLRNIVRASQSGYPILLQGPTSAGKTSMIEYLASMTGNRLVRINNHEHTDLQEYIGSYVWDEKEQRLRFQVGILVQALKNGWWVVLDELNLAPSDVLEALNRLLDDNRELLIPDTGEVVKPAKGFLLFATQNPAGSIYGGRKFLSRAFRNRFIELHFSNIPSTELSLILEKRCKIAPSYAKKLVQVFLDLQKRRTKSKIFSGRDGFMTLRDLFRWGYRETEGGEQALAEDGFMLLAERVRTEEERQQVKQVLETHLRCKIDETALYSRHNYDLISKTLPESLTVVWTTAMKRIYTLVKRAFDHNEPVLLVGETGCGKTTVMQIAAAFQSKKLHIVNCHQNSETSDFIGSIRPVRNASRTTAPFEWNDGPLVQALKSGDLFLLDEISLADDSVLERLNSVLEPNRLLVLAEKGSTQVEEINGKDGFQFCATMNPGGDFGKKELSPALRNRFTEIWIGSAWKNEHDLAMMIESKLNDDVFGDRKSYYCAVLFEFIGWFLNLFRGDEKQLAETDSQSVISLRDVLGWIEFMNISNDLPSFEYAFLHGAAMVIIDGIELNSYSSTTDAGKLKQLCIQKLGELLGKSSDQIADTLRPLTSLGSFNCLDGDYLMIDAFKLQKRQCSEITVNDYAFQTSTTMHNVLRVIRAMQVPSQKPVLLEGSPGVGKTSLISALARLTGHKLVRINLSEQTDLYDLFGNDMPVEDEKDHAALFAWRNGPLLQAMEDGDWVLLDELNLASQSVLEGLNACLDHRTTVYIPELDRYFKCAPGFRVFGAQNPLSEGGGRKGLPKSFLNRFIRVYVSALTENDMFVICRQQYDEDLISSDILKKMIRFNQQLYEKTMVTGEFGKIGKPWEFNLRDILRWLDLLASSHSIKQGGVLLSVGDFVQMLYVHRMRDKSDRTRVVELYKSVFESDDSLVHPIIYYLAPKRFHLNELTMERGSVASSKNLQFLSATTPYLYSMMSCIQMKWMPILVGKSGCGKTESVRLLAQLMGKQLEEISMNHTYDAGDLLGGFEQVDITHLEFSIVERLLSFVENIKKYCVSGEIEDVAHQLRLNPHLKGAQMLGLHLDKLFNMLPILDHHKTKWKQLLQDIENCKKIAQSESAGRFAWVDGPLVKALEQGHWVLIDNANLCNPSVLDRLNSLLEPNGFLAISECGLINSQLRKVRPHENFRLFMTVNSENGSELSRAMRNRGVEIYMGDADIRDGNDLLKQFISFGLGSEELVSHFEDGENNHEITSRELVEINQRYLLHADNIKLNCVPSSSWPVTVTGKFLLNHAEVAMGSLALSIMAKSFTLGESALFSASLIYFLTSSLNDLRLRAFLLRKQFAGVVVLMDFADFLDSFSRSPIGETIRDMEICFGSEIADLPFGYHHLFTPATLSASGIRFKEHVQLCLHQIRLLFMRTHLKEHLQIASQLASDERSILQTAFLNASREQISHSLEMQIDYLLFSMIHEAFSLLDHSLGSQDSENAINWLETMIKSSSNGKASYSTLLAHMESFLQSVRNLPNFSSYSDRVGPKIAKLRLDSRLESSLKIWSEFSLKQILSDESLQLILGRLKILQNNKSLDLNSKRAILEAITSLYEIQSLSEKDEGRVALIDQILKLLLKYESDLPCVEENNSKVQQVVTLHNYYALNREMQVIASPSTKCPEFIHWILSNLDRPISELQPLQQLLWSDEPSQSVLLMAFLSLHRFLATSYAQSLNVFANSVELPMVQSQINFGESKIKNIVRDQRSTQQLLEYFKTDRQQIQDNIQLDSQMLRWFQSWLKTIDSDVQINLNFERNLFERGCEWMRLATSFLRLYICSVAFDPAQVLQCSVQHISLQINRLEALHLVFNDFFKLFAQNEQVVPSWVCDLEQKLNDLKCNYTELCKNCPRRPETSQIKELHVEFVSAFETFVASANLRNLSSASSDYLSGLISNILHFIARIRQRFTEYSDVLAPLELGLYLMAHGARFITTSQNPIPPEEKILQLIACDDISLKSYLEVRNSILCPSDSRSASLSFNCIMACLAHVEYRLQIEGPKNALVQVYGQILEDFILIWEAIEQEEKNQKEAESSLFKYKPQQDDEIESEYLKVFQQFDGDWEELEVGQNVVKARQFSADSQLYCEMIRRHGALISNATSTSSEVLNNYFCLLLESRSSVLKFISHEQLFYQSHLDTKFALTHIQRLNSNELEWKKCNQEKFDFYHDQNLPEVSKAFSALTILDTRIIQLLEQWPEHTSLVELRAISQRILEFPIDSPLPKLLTGLEFIMEKSQDWELYACRDNSLASELKLITDLILSWRKMELEQWNMLLKKQEQKTQSSVYKFWFHLARTLLRAPEIVEDTDQHLFEIQSILTEFMMSSNLGSFEMCLDMLKNFSKHLALLCQCNDAPELIPYRQQLMLLLDGTYVYFSQFSFEAKTMKQELVKPLEKDIMDYKKLVSWRDINWTSLKESAQKTHKKIAKLLRQYSENVLNVPVTKVFEKYHENLDAKLIDRCTAWTNPDLNQVQIEFELPNFAPLSDSLSFIENLGGFKKVGERFNYFMRNGALSAISQHVPTAGLDSLNETILLTVADFQEQNKQFAFATKENIGLIKNLRKMKQTALVDLLRCLRRIGMSYRARPIDQETKFKQLKAIQLCQHQIPIDSRILEAANSYYPRLLSRLDILESNSMRPSPQLSREQVSKSKGLLFSLVESIAVHREQLQTLLNISGDFLRQSAFIATLADPVSVLTSDRTLVDSEAALYQLIDILVEARATLLNQRLPVIDIEAVLEEAVDLRNQLIFKLHSNCYQLKNIRILSFSSKQITEGVHLLLKKSSPLLREHPFLNSENLLTKISALSQRINQNATESTSESQSNNDLTIVKQQLEGKIRKVMVVVQELYCQGQSESSSLESIEAVGPELKQNHVVELFKRTKQVNTTLRVSKIFRMVEDLLQSFAECGPQSFTIVRDLAQTVKPFIETYSFLLLHYLNEQLGQQKSMLKLSYVLCNMFTLLYQRGYCVPEDINECDDSDDGNDNDQGELSGTGIDEGEGKKDVSNEIEDEEQVLGLKDQPESKTQDSQECAEEQDGIEMENDFDGAIMDVDKTDEQDDNEQEEEDDDSKSIDDEMGDLQSSEQTDVIDEKLWNPEDEESPDNRPENVEKGAEAKVDNQPTEMAAKPEETEDMTNEQNKDKDTPEREHDNDEQIDFQEKDEKINEQDATEENHGIEARDDRQANSDDGEDSDKDNFGEDIMLDNEEDRDAADQHDENSDAVTDPMEDDSKDQLEIPDDAKSQEVDEDEITDVPDEKLGATEQADSEAPMELENNAEEQTSPEILPSEQNAQNQENQQQEQIQSREQLVGNVGLSSSSAEMEQPDATDDDPKSGIQNDLTSTSDSHGSATESAEKNKSSDESRASNHDEFNPNRNLASAITAWKRRLDAIDKSSKDSKTPDEKQENNENPRDDVQYEFVENEQDQADAQTMAAADAQQISGQNLNELPDQFETNQRIDENTHKHENDDTQMEMDGNQQISHLPLDSSADGAAEDNVPSNDQEQNHLIPDSENTPISSSPDDKVINEFCAANSQSGFGNFGDDRQQPITEKKFEELRAEMEQELHVCRLDETYQSAVDVARTIWNQCERATNGLAMHLCEQLRLVLEPTQMTKLKGDYRTGKRLNMKKIIPFIASQYKKDKIWLRRTKPHKRQYQVMLCVDDSKSMSESKSVQLAYESLALIARALSLLEVGQLGVVRFGESVQLVHPFDRPFTSESGAEVVRQLQFKQKNTHVRQLMDTAIDVLHDQRRLFGRQQSSASGQLWQLQIIISDGICEDHDQIRRIVSRAAELHILVVFIIIDAHGNDKSDLLSTKNVSFVDGKLVMREYMETFPFDYYVILRDINGLPDTLSSALRQWFEVLNSH